MEQVEAKRILRTVADRIEGESDNFEWAVIGSVNMLLHGMEVSPEDIDIITLPGHARKLEVLFSERVVESLSEFSDSLLDNYNSYRLVLDFDGVEVEVIGEEPGGLYSRYLDSTESIHLDGRKFPCITLDSEAEGYRRIGREEKAKRIENFLDRN